MQTIPFFHVPRPTQEKNDCVVRALANATGMGYDAAYDIVSAEGRRPMGRTKHNTTIAIFDRYGKQVRTSETVKMFVLARPKGIFIANIRGHVFAIRDGVVLDTFAPKPGCIVQIYWTVEEAAPLQIERAYTAPPKGQFDLGRLMSQIKSVSVAMPTPEHAS